MADEHAEARFLVGDVVLGGISLFGDERIARRGEQFHRHGRRGAGLGDGFGNVLGFLRRAADEHAGPGGGQRQEPVGVAETEFVELDVQAGGQTRHAVRRFHAHGQNNQVKFLLRQLAVFVEEQNAQVLAAGQLDDARRDALDVMDVLLRPGALVILVEILAVRADVHVENRRVQSLRRGRRRPWPVWWPSCSRWRSNIHCRTSNRANRRIGSRRCVSPRGHRTGG